MQIKLEIEGNLRALMKRETETGRVSVSSAMGRIGKSVKQAWRGQIISAGLGGRLANTIRDQVYPIGKPSMNAVAFIHTKAPVIIAAHDEGPLIRARNGVWLAIPLPAAGKGFGGSPMTPGQWQFKNGKKLVFLQNNPRSAVLAAEDGVRVNARGVGVRDRRRVRAGSQRQTTLVPIFVLVRQAKLPKRLNLAALADQGASAAASLIVNGWKD